MNLPESMRPRETESRTARKQIGEDETGRKGGLTGPTSEEAVRNTN